ncbi:DUF4238 domain-containing protein [Cyanobacteria bacterium FACHB-63]|nr:DUF4238 domain-containing protein [Cyanobacteria bacterium FACHB-63]
MADKKKQHYIPRFYLKNFSLNNSERAIRIFNLASSKFIPSGNLKDQAYKNYFYGRDLKLENALGILEGISAKVIRDIVAQNSVPAKGSQDYSTLLLFIISLSYRTPYRVEQLNELADKFAKAALSKESSAQPLLNDCRFVMSDPIQVAIRNATLYLPLALDLGLKVAINKTQEFFITSDHPVVLYNQFLEPRKKYGSNTGLACKGLEIFLPISPRHLLILFDRDVYGVGNRNDVVIDVTNGADVKALNLLQCISANENLYFNEEISEAQIRYLMNHANRRRREAKANVDEYVNSKTDEEMRFLLHLYGADVKCSLSLSFIRLLKKAKQYILGDKVLHVRDPRRCKLLEQFAEQVKKGKYRASDFQKFLRDASGLT